MANDEHQAFREMYQRMQVAEPPLPWRRVLNHVGGVTAVGFGPGTELLLVLTHSGVGVIDCTTGAVVVQEAESEQMLDDPYPVSAPGIGPLAGQNVCLGGLWGGGLKTIAPDGWVVHRVAPNWPTECAVLCPPDAPELDDSGASTMVVKDLDPPIRALGFSDSGRSLVVASTELFLWHRS